MLRLSGYPPNSFLKSLPKPSGKTLTHTYTLYTHTHTRDSINKGASPSGLWWWWWSAAYFGKSAEQMVPHDPSPVCWMPTSLQPTNITCLVRVQLKWNKVLSAYLQTKFRLQTKIIITMGYLPSVMIIDNVCVQEINTITTRKQIFAILQTYLMSGIRVLKTI